MSTRLVPLSEKGGYVTTLDKGELLSSLDAATQRAQHGRHDLQQLDRL